MSNIEPDDFPSDEIIAELYCHIIFWTRRLLSALSPYMLANAQAVMDQAMFTVGGEALAAGGTENHLHILARRPLSLQQPGVDRLLFKSLCESRNQKREVHIHALGGRRMTRVLPGTVGVAGREYAYIECVALDSFRNMFFTIGTHTGSPVPTAGGIMNEEAAIRLPSGRLMCAVSYRGDIEGWRRKVAEWCKDRTIVFGLVQGQAIMLSNGEQHALSECEPASG